MVVVLVIMLVLTIGGLALAAIVTNTTSTLVSSRSTTESRAAADAGLADAVAVARRTGSFCGIDVSSSSAPRYSVTSTCTDTHVTFTSVGTAGRSHTTMETEYEYSVENASYIGADMYFYSSATFSSDVLTHSLDGDLLSVIIPFGGFTCNAAVPANIIMLGNFKTEGNCNVQGSVVGGGTATMTNASDTVQGNLIASGTGQSLIRGTVGGNLQTGGPLSFSGGSKIVSGSVIAGGGVTIGGESIRGSLTLPAGATLNPATPTTAQVGGGVIRATVAPPVLPEMPAWYEYKFNAADWNPFSGKSFGTPIVLNNSNTDPTKRCSYFTSSPNTGWTALSNLTTPTIIDARACGLFTSNNGGNPVATLKTDVVLLANSFNLTTLTMKAAAGASPNVWFITEDNTADGSPTCGSSQGSLVINGTVINAPVRAMIYTPCLIDIQGQNIDTWNGNFYSGSFKYGGKFNFYGDPIAFPGMAEASSSGSNAAKTLGTLVAQRDIP
nr:hypothetical protein [Microbacterium bovistercoris]